MLNGKLTLFLDSVGHTRDHYPNIDPLCLESSAAAPPPAAISQHLMNVPPPTHQIAPKVIVPAFPPPASMPPTNIPPPSVTAQPPPLAPTLVNCPAFVKEILTDTSGILQDSDRRWMCYFETSHMPPGVNLRQNCPPNYELRMNAKMVDGKRQIQYLALAVWDPTLFPPCPENDSKPASDKLVQKYFDVNEIFAFSEDQPQTEEASHSQETQPNTYDNGEGEVYKILDNNFGIIRIGNNLVLFDVCDYWVDPGKTASMAKLKLGEATKVGVKVRFNANLLAEKERVAYLASSVWWSNNITINIKPIHVNQINADKINIFNMVIQSVRKVVPDLKAEVSMPKLPEVVETPVVKDDLLRNVSGTVRTEILGKRNVHIGGILDLDGRPGEFCVYFPPSCYQTTRTKLPKLNSSVKAAMMRVQDQPWANKVQYVAIALTDDSWKVDLRLPALDEVGDKYLELLKIFNQILESLGKDNRLLRSLREGKREKYVKLPDTDEKPR